MRAARDGGRVRGTKPLELVLLPVRVGCPAASCPSVPPTAAAAVATQRVHIGLPYKTVFIAKVKQQDRRIYPFFLYNVFYSQNNIDVKLLAPYIEILGTISVASVLFLHISRCVPTK